MGESILKGKKTWTRWAASRLCFTGIDWAQEWTNELASCGLPGPDYLVRAPNFALTACGSIGRPSTEFFRGPFTSFLWYTGVNRQQR